MNLNSRKSLIARLRKGKAVRAEFIESNLAKSLAHNLRATRDRLDWSQERLAAEVGMNQNAVSRLESSDYGKQTITTLKRLAKAMDVALIVRFIPFSELIDWISGTRHVDDGLSTESLAVPSFSVEDEAGMFDIEERIQPKLEREAHRFSIPAMPLNSQPAQEPNSPVENAGECRVTAAGIVNIGSFRDALKSSARQTELGGRLPIGAAR
jgi:transcriptional regulator with XRE-family HTH domain